jgi:hypothetical protein
MHAREKIAQRKPAGVTLLELLLALALSVVVMTAIGMAINLHFKMLDARRTSIEEMQMIRVIAMRMTSDIRTIVNPVTPDLSGLETTFANAMQAATAQATAEASGAPLVIGGQGDSGQSNSGQGNNTQGASGQTGGGTQQGSAGGTQQAGGAQGSAGGGQGATSGQAGGGGQSGGQTGQTAAGGQNTGGQQGAAAGTSGSASGQTAGASTDSSSSSTSAVPAVQLIGSGTELRFDISRLPRLDQYQGIMAKGELSATDLPSDVKTIVYFIRSETSAASYAQDPTAPGGEPSTDTYGRGLMRAELDRAVTSYSETGGATDAVYASAQLLAEEVTGLSFEYYDGTEWLTEWDSSSQGLPRSIKIWLSVKATYGMTEEQLANAAAGQAPEEISFYCYVNLPTTPLVVPAAEPTTTESTTTTTDAASASTTTTQGATP